MRYSKIYTASLRNTYKMQHAHVVTKMWKQRNII